MKTVVFRSSISLGLAVFLSLVLGITSTIMILDGAWIGLGINGLVLLAVFTLYRTTKYTLTGEGLEIRSGLFRQFICWKDIRKVKYTSNPISSPAFSLKRIQIDHGKMGSVLISPHTRESFMAEYQKFQAISSMR